MEKVKLRRGEMVWARVVYPHQWWPGAVLRQDFLGVLVSFFNSHNPNPRYFIESEVVAFEPNFKSLVHKCTNHALLNRALSSLKRRRCSHLNLFQLQPRVLLSFLRSVAVSPCVEVEVADYLTAANAFTQFTAFRRHFFSSASGVHSRVQADPASEEKLHWDAAELDDLEVGDDCPELSEEAEDNLPACLMNGNNISNLLPEDSSNPRGSDQLEISSTSQTEQKIQPFQEMMVKLQILALDPFYLDRECLNTLKSNFLSFRNFSYKSTSDNLCKKFPSVERDKAQLVNPGYITFQQGIKVHGEKEKTTCSLVPYVESPINCLGFKRQLDQSATPEPPLKLRKTLSFSINQTDAYFWRSCKGFNAFLSDTSISGNAFLRFCELFNAMPFSSIEAYAHLLRIITGSESDLFESFFSGSQLDFKTHSLSAIVAQSSSSICGSSLKDLVLNSLNFSLVKHTACSSNQKIAKISGVQKLDEDVDTVDYCETHASHSNVQQQEDCGPIMENLGTLISYADDVTDKLMQPPAESLSKDTFGTHNSDNEASGVSRGTQNYQLHSRIIPDELQMMPCNSEGSNSVKMNRERSMKVTSGYSFKEKKLTQPITSALAVKSKVGHQSEVQTTLANSRSLLMKFPKDFSLPSKEELVKKFSPFGMVDCLNTKVYFYTGTARVVFLHQLDAMAAYQYAKRKKIAFGKANVKFWLDPSQDKRGTKNLVSSLSCTTELPGFNLKSCLKKCRRLEKEGKRCPKKVRFLIET